LAGVAILTGLVILCGRRPKDLSISDGQRAIEISPRRAALRPGEHGVRLPPITAVDTVRPIPVEGELPQGPQGLRGQISTVALDSAVPIQTDGPIQFNEPGRPSPTPDFPIPSRRSGVFDNPDLATRTHRVIDGESLESIAERHLGNRSRAREIFEWNRDRLADPQVLPLGVYLRIPPRWTDVSQVTPQGVHGSDSPPQGAWSPVPGQLQGNRTKIIYQPDPQMGDLERQVDR
jgi:hypothetical protein